MEAVLVPVKRLADAKLRLAGALGPHERRRLAVALLSDVLAAASSWPLRLVVSADPDAIALAAAQGWEVVADPGAGLNAALAAGTDRAAALGASALLVLPFDVALATQSDLAGLFAVEGDVVVARSDDGGTTALLRRPPAAIATCFGPDSAAAHRAAGRAAGLRVASVVSPGLVLDVDTVEDLRRLAASGSAGAGAAVARELLAAGSPAG